MQKLVLKIIQLLDGTPTVYGKSQRGQSLVEMALITPILIIMLMGMVEIGWFANNYLTLLDVTRAGARHGAVLQDQFSPLFWNNDASYVPAQWFGSAPDSNNFQDQGLLLGDTSILAMPYTGDAASQLVQRNARGGQRGCNLPVESQFYREVACVMMASMEPLSFDAENNTDDIIISGFSIARITDTPGNPVIITDSLRSAVNPSADTLNVVVGRYPTNANECDVQNTGTGAVPIFQVLPRERDPFDINENGVRDLRPDAGGPRGTGVFNELDGRDIVESSVSLAEKQVGFSVFGQHLIPGTGCIGSVWKVADIERLINLPNYELTDELRRSQLPFQGLVLVEIYWEHDMLLKFPLFNPLVNIFSGDLSPTISVWAVFPMPSVEPNASQMGLP
ncbi:MAG: pilus assembly protein [Anaerolineae bacterium]|nr:pilus assembly protein [Anaerolineae bacterium]